MVVFADTIAIRCNCSLVDEESGLCSEQETVASIAAFTDSFSNSSKFHIKMYSDVRI